MAPSGSTGVAIGELFRPLEAVVGGLFIGAACGIYMLTTGRIAGNSGALKSLVLGPMETTKVTFIGGLLLGGIYMKALLPTCFASTPPSASLALVASGLAVGLGTALGNGCTSGHGLCGLSRLSLRSLVAVPVFMVTAIGAATWSSGATFGPMVPIGTTSASTVAVAWQAAAGLAAGLVPLALIPVDYGKEAYAGLWTGLCFAVGLSVGGMVRPSVVTSALAPAHFDPTLWVLFMTALATTFVFYRVADALGVKAANAYSAASSRRIDGSLVLGAALFGLGWGTSGLCPGPHIVGLGADPTARGPLAMLAAVSVGMLLARPVGRLVGQ